MTHRATGPSSEVPKVWLLPVVALAVLAGLVAAGMLSRSIALDFVTWWPVWLIVALLALLVRRRHLRRVRLSGLVAVLATLLVGLLVAAHLLAWPALPSSELVLVGQAPQGVETAALSARIDGEVRLRGGAEYLYRVEPLRLGGEIGVPDAEEQSAESAVVVELVADPDPGFYGFSGWDIFLSPVPAWSLTLQGEVDADLSGLSVSGVQAEGRGRLVLGPVSGPTPVSVVGEFTIEVSRGVAIRIVGQAAVPSDWETLSDGSRSPTPGEGWLVSAGPDASLTVVYEQAPPG
jgi:hypothetical protein